MPETKPTIQSPGQLSLSINGKPATVRRSSGRNNNGASPEHEYDESKVKTLSSLEHIRLRTGMYIGRLGDGSNPDDGIYVLLKEVIDNAVDEFIMGYGKKIDVSIEDNRVRVRDYGRGIPLGKVIDCVSIINTGAKYNDDVFQFSVGLNGVGTKAVNALASDFKAVAYREGEFFEARFERGRLKKKLKGRKPGEPDGSCFEFLPDVQIFGDDFAFNFDYVRQRLWNYACLNSGLSLVFNKERLVSRNGLLDFLTREVGETALYEPLYHKSQYLEFAFSHTASFGETYFSFVNGQHTSDGGAHQSAFREGILKGVNEFYKKNYNGIDVRESISGAVAVKLKAPVFESQTKNKLGNTDIRGWIVAEVKSAVVDLLHKNQSAAGRLSDKIAQNEKLRKELNAVKKEAKEAARKIAIKIPHFKDCKFHLGQKKHGEDSTIFITEGPSAAGSMVAARDVLTQAIFGLKGVPLNVFGKNKAAVYKNEELYNLMMALGIEDSIENLRFNKIVIATDADHDGYHIRYLLLTYFLNYFEELVLASHLYILETPLFRVRNSKVTRYCYNKRERDSAVAEVKNPEITRFKGLGEISPKEFGQFIGDDIRLVKVNIRSISEIANTLSFYMGKNTPERRDYIIENLI